MTLTVTGKLKDVMFGKFNRSEVADFILSNDGTLFEASAVTKVRMCGDINIDGNVDGKDLTVVALSFGSYPGNPHWNPVADENEDGKIDGKDLVSVARNFGRTYT